MATGFLRMRRLDNRDYRESRRREDTLRVDKALISYEIVRDSLDASAADPDLRARGSNGNSIAVGRAHGSRSVRA
jgi:hypothetical protein